GVSDACAPGRRAPAAFRAAQRLRLQRDPVQGRGGGCRLVAGPQRLQAPCRPGAEPGRDRQGLRCPRRAGVHRGHRGARAGRQHQRGRRRSRVAGTVPGGPGPAAGRHWATAAGERELPAAQGRPELPAAAGAARGHREPDHRRAPALHPGGAGLQHLHPPLPGQPHREAVRLRHQAELHRGRRRGDRGRAGGGLRTARRGMSLRRLAGWLLLPCLLLPAWAVAQALQPIPPLDAPVVDTTGTLDTATVQRLEARALALQASKGSQLQVLMVPTTEPEDIAAYAQRVYDQWKLGRESVDDGVLVLVAKDDRRVRIQPGYGLEGAIPDATAARVIQEYMVPRFREGDFGGGLDEATAVLARLVEGEPLPEPMADSRPLR